MNASLLVIISVEDNDISQIKITIKTFDKFYGNSLTVHSILFVNTTVLIYRFFLPVS